MDEYCEWHVERDAASGKVVRVDVTTELPEYWAYMHATSPETVLALYREHVSPRVMARDLVDRSGTYDKYNTWNTEQGCMHLQQPADTASAAVGISGSSTAQLVDALGRRIPGKQKLMEAHGDTRAGSTSPLRGSDPSITQDIYELCAPGAVQAKLTLADPIGVYMDEVDVSGWAAPDGSPLARDDVVTLARGAKGKALRYSIAVPDGRGVRARRLLRRRPAGRVRRPGVKNAITAYLPVETYRAPIAPPSVRAPALAATAGGGGRGRGAHQGRARRRVRRAARRTTRRHAGDKRRARGSAGSFQCCRARRS